MKWVLIRHEEAEPAGAEGDEGRCLTALGRRRMHAQARALFDRLPGLDRIVTSPLVRAVQTAEILVGAFDLDTPVDVVSEIAYPSHPRALRGVLERRPTPMGVVALVGHEPTLSAFATSMLSGSSIDGFRTGQACLLDIEGGRVTFDSSLRGGEELS
ncbi:MAG: histidine phosphatase family protein [Myxococcota bacterium]